MNTIIGPGSRETPILRKYRHPGTERSEEPGIHFLAANAKATCGFRIAACVVRNDK